MGSEKSKTEAELSPRQRHKRQLTRTILDKACMLFARKGYDGTSLTDIAEAAGLTRAAVYYYFKNKEALLEAIIDDNSRQPVERSLKIRREMASSPTEQLHEFVRMHVQSILGRQVQMKMINVTETALPEELSRKHQAAKRAFLEEFREIIRLGIQAGEFRPVDDRLAAFGVIGMGAWSVQWFNPEGELSAEEIACQIADLAVHSIGVHTGGQKPLSSPKDALEALQDDLDMMKNLIKTIG